MNEEQGGKGFEGGMREAGGKRRIHHFLLKYDKRDGSI